MASRKTSRKSSSARSSRRRSKTLNTRLRQTTTKAKRSVRRAAKNVQFNAARATELGRALVRAGELIQEGALFLNSMAERVSNSDQVRTSG